jgi:polyvinyl alcohol dehydrogenase (cytochrome)
MGDRDLALFGARRGHVYAIDAATGETVWKVNPDDDPAAQVTGAPNLFDKRLFVPIPVGDDSAAVDLRYECCKGRGAINALDAASGETDWETLALPESMNQRKNRVGTQLWGPSGASVWASPTIDAKRRRLYVGTGDKHSAPATATSNAILALGARSPEYRLRQAIAGRLVPRGIGRSGPNLISARRQVNGHHRAVQDDWIENFQAA